VGVFFSIGSVQQWKIGSCASVVHSAHHGSRFNFVVTAAQKFRGQGGVGPVVRWFGGPAPPLPRN